MLKLLVTVGIAYALVVALVYALQERLLYLPDLPGRSHEGTPADLGLAYEDVTLEASDGVPLHGWLVRGASSRVVLFFHGNAGNVSHRLASIRQLVDLGPSVFVLDYRGYGRSGGRPSEAGLGRDADAAWRYLVETRGVPRDEVVILGRSLGASVAARLASEVRPLGLVLESGFTSVPDVAAEIYGWLPVRWLSRLRHATREDLRQVECPVLIVHSRDDEIIPFHHGEALFEAAPEPRAFVALRGGHNDAFLLDERTYLDGLRFFLGGLGADAPGRDAQ